jgi:hypothetical protein
MAIQEPTAQAQPPAEPQAQPQANARPDWLPEKFSSAEDMAKAYAELEKRQSQGGNQEPPAQPITGSGVVADLMTEAAEIVNSGGTLTPEIYQKFEQAGIPKSLVDETVEGRKSKADGIYKELTDMFGGEAERTNIINWASTGLSADERQAFNEAMRSGDMFRARSAVNLVVQKYQSEFASGNRDLFIQEGEGGKPVGGYASKADMVKDMSDPRYEKDEAFRQAVRARLQATPSGIL